LVPVRVLKMQFLKRKLGGDWDNGGIEASKKWT